MNVDVDLDRRDAADDADLEQDPATLADRAVGGGSVGWLNASPGSITGLLIGVGVAILIVLVLIEVFTDVSAAAAVTGYWRGVFGTQDLFAETLVRFVPVAIVGLGAALALRGGLFNLGGEGQIVSGAMLGYMVLRVMSGLPAPVVVPLAIVAGGVGGAIWMILPAALKAAKNVSVILSTLLMNYVALALVEWVLTERWLLGQPNAAVPQSAPIEARYELASIWPSTRLHLGALFVVVMVAVLWFYFRTPQGFRVELLGANRRLAEQSGVRARRTETSLLLASAGVAGIAGVTQLVGIDYRLTAAITGGVGFTGVLVAIIGKGRPIATVLAAMAFTSLVTGGERVESDGVPRSFVLVMQGLIVLGVTMGGIFGPRLVRAFTRMAG